MISASTKEGFTIALQAAKYIALSVAVDVLKPVFVYCAESLHSVQPHPQKEVEPEVAQVTDPAEVRDVAEEDQPPHFVVARVRRCTAPERKGKSICQLRRHDNNAWLWTSTPYVSQYPAIRDATRAAARFGWEILNTNFERGAADDEGEDATTDIDRSVDRALYRKPLEAIAQFVRAARDGKEAHADVLGEIAVVLETALEMDNCVLWPDRYVPASGIDRKMLLERHLEYTTVCDAMWNWLAAEEDKNPGKNWMSALMFFQAIHTREIGTPIPASCSSEAREWLSAKFGNATRQAIVAKTADYQARAASVFQGKEK